MLIAFLLGSIEYTLILIYYISFYLACDRESYTSETGTIKYPSSGNYEPNLNCFFRITVAEGKRVKITFLENFDFASGTFIENLRFSNIPKPTTDGNYSSIYVSASMCSWLVYKLCIQLVCKLTKSQNVRLRLTG